MMSANSVATTTLESVRADVDANEPIPNRMLCPIMQELMFDPVVASDGFTYDRPVLRKILETSHKSPFTREVLNCRKVFDHNDLQRDTAEFLERHPKYQPSLDPAQLEAIDRAERKRNIPRHRSIAIILHHDSGKSTLSSNQWFRQILRSSGSKNMSRLGTAFATQQEKISDRPRQGYDGIPRHMICPLTQKMMLDPVVAWDGSTYEYAALRRAAIESYGDTPAFCELFEQEKMIDNGDLQREILEFLEKNPSKMPILTSAQTDAVARAVSRNIPRLRAISILRHDLEQSCEFSADDYLQRIYRALPSEKRNSTPCVGHGTRLVQRYGQPGFTAADADSMTVSDRHSSQQFPLFPVREPYVQANGPRPPVPQQRALWTGPEPLGQARAQPLRRNAMTASDFGGSSDAFPELVRMILEAEVEQVVAAVYPEHPELETQTEAVEVSPQRYLMNPPSHERLGDTTMHRGMHPRRQNLDPFFFWGPGRNAVPFPRSSRTRDTDLLVRQDRLTRRTAHLERNEPRTGRLGAALHPRLLESESSLPHLDHVFYQTLDVSGNRHPERRSRAMMRYSPTTQPPRPALLFDRSAQVRVPTASAAVGAPVLFEGINRQGQRARRQNAFWSETRPHRRGDDRSPLTSFVHRSVSDLVVGETRAQQALDDAVWPSVPEFFHAPFIRRSTPEVPDTNVSVEETADSEHSDQGSV